MLKLSARSEYALLLVKFLVDHPGTASLTDVAKDLDIPEPILRKVSQQLVAHGICVSKMGRNGGVELIGDSPSLYNVLVAMGEDMNIALCSQSGACTQESGCRVSPTLKRLQRGMESLLKITKV